MSSRLVKLFSHKRNLSVFSLFVDECCWFSKVGVLASTHHSTIIPLNCIATFNQLTLKAFRYVLLLLVDVSRVHAGPSGKAVRQYFPYVSSESDLQRYKAITFHKHPSNDTRASSSLSNVPSDSTRTKVGDAVVDSTCI